MNGSMPFNCAALARYTESSPLGEHPVRPRGRPKTRTADHYTELLKAHESLSKWFADGNGRPANSDIELLTSWFSASLQQRSLRASRIDSREVQAKLKTLRNELSVARRMVAANPIKPALSGTFKGAL